MQRKKPSLPSRTTRDNEEDGARRVGSPPGLVRRSAYGHSHTKVAMKTAYYHPAMKSPRSDYTSEESAEENVESENVRVKSRASHESMESADERNMGSDSDEEDSSDDVPLNKNTDSPLNSDKDAPTDALEQSDDSDDDLEEEEEVKPPVTQSAGTPEGLKLAMMTSGEREALLRQELRVPPSKPKYGKRKNVNKGGHSSSSGQRRVKLREPAPQSEQGSETGVKQEPPPGSQQKPDQKPVKQPDDKPNETGQKPDQNSDQKRDEEPAAKRTKESE